MKVMTFLKCLVTGFLAAIVAPIIWVLAALGIALVRVAVLTRSDSGGLGAVSFEDPAIYVAPIAFCLGFYWQFRRSSRLRSPRP